MNEVVKFAGGGVPATQDDLIKGLQNIKSSVKGSTGGLLLLRLLRSGEFAYGPEYIEPEENSEWALNPETLQHGWACWGDGELLDERMVSFRAPVPPKGELPDLGEPWAPQMSVQMQCLNGEDEGTVVLYKGTSLGLRNAIDGVIDQLLVQVQKDIEHIVPVLRLFSDSYTHKRYGEIFYPVLEIVRWVSYEGEAAASGAVEDQTGNGESEAAANQRKADEEQQQKDNEDPPRRKRRSKKKASSGTAEGSTRRRRRRSS